MKTTQAWGWLTAGVLALGLNGFYQDSGAAWGHRVLGGAVARIVDRSGAVLALAAGRVDWFAERANIAAARNETASCRFASAMARFQTKIARTQGGMAQFEAMSARQEAALAQLEANRARLEEQMVRVHIAPVAFNVGKIPVVACPRVRVNVPRVSVPRVQIPMVNIPAPVVHVETLGNEPI